MGKARVLCESTYKQSADQMETPYVLKNVGQGPINSTSSVRLTLSPEIGKYNLEIEADIVTFSSIAYTTNTSFPTKILSLLSKFPLARITYAIIVDRLKLHLSMFEWTISGFSPVRAASAS